MKKLALLVFLLGSLLLVGNVSAGDYGPNGPDYALCTQEGGSDWDCTDEVVYDDYSYAFMYEEEEIQGRWNVAIPTNAMINDVTVSVMGIELNPEIKVNVQLWSSYTDESLTDYQQFPYNEWTILSFKDSRLIDEVQERVTNGEEIELELDFEEGSDCLSQVKIDYFWLKIEYTIPQCKVIVDEPQECNWYDPVDILWHYEGTCDILDQELYYHYDNCETPSISIEELDNAWQREYAWDVSEFEDGDYCVCVYAEQRFSLPGVEGCSGIFHLDQTPPESEIYFGNPSMYIDDYYYISTETPIYIECEDEGSGPDTIYYEIYVEDGEGGWELVHEFDEESDEAMFYCHEESRHKIVYWCEDKVGKVEKENEEIIFVDTTPPVIEKDMGGPWYGDCPPEDKEDECYINGVTEIYVDAWDDDPHPVGDVVCAWDYEVIGGDKIGHGEEGLIPPFVIQFPEESIHELYIICWDGLDNYVEDIEYFIVDKTSPEIWKEFEGPFYEDDGMKWINGVTEIYFGAYDAEPHPSGIAELKYRVTLVDDEYCEDEELCQECDGGECEWNDVEGTEYEFQIEEESCHLIEIYAEDNVEKHSLHKQCVFVDKTAPEPIKEVGEPSHDCHSLWEDLVGKCEEDWDWIITMDTEIYLSCEDQEPHPSGTAEICYRWFLDGELEEDWQCVKDEEVIIQFYEESEHLLEFYCVDNVNKTSDTDSELFKVEGEEFTIELYKKWNLISIPFNLISSSIEEVFDQIDEELEVVWAYYDGEWHVYSPEGPSDLETIEPGYGYWVKLTCEGYADDEVCEELVIGGSLLSPGPGVPPSRPLDEGWNLIGHYGTDDDVAYCSLFSLIDTTIGYPKWNALYGYNAEDDEFEPLAYWDYTYPGKGYWISMDEDEIYSPSTICWGFIGP